MPGLNDEGSGGSSSPPAQPAAPLQLVNISVGDESLTTALTKSLRQEDSKATPTNTPEFFSSQSSNNNNVNNFASGSSDAKSDSINNDINNYPGINPNNSIKTALDNYSQRSNPYANSPASSNYGSNPYADSTASTIGANSGKAMEVTVTILSLHGIAARRNNSSIKKKKREEKKRTKRLQRGGARSAEIDKPTATIVASFSQNLSKDKVFLTHVPSLPVSLTPDAPGSPALGSDDANSSNASGSSGEVLRPVVHWSSMDADDEEAGRALSTLRFKRKFVRENDPNANPGSADRYLPQACPINLSISRNGRMALLGKVNLIINGEERGKGSVTVPVTSSIRPSKSTLPTPNPVKMGKKIRNMGKSKDASGETEKTTTPMARIKGDTYQFGLEGGAMLRMLVHVHDPDVIPEEESFCAEEAYGDAEHGDDAYGDEAHGDSGAAYGDDAGGAYREDSSISDSDRHDNDSISDNKENECLLSVEGDNPSILGGDDYFDHLHSSNELHALRQQLAKSEQTNNILQMELAKSEQTNNILQIELADAQHSANQLSQLTMQHKVEYDALVLKLQLATQNSNALLQEVEAAKSECELLPIYENRVTELLEELRKRDEEVKELTERMERRDSEVDCLKEQTDTLSEKYQTELVDSLLWDNDDDDDDGDTNLDSKSNDDGSTDVKADEKKASDDPLDKWGVRKLGISLSVVPEEKGGDVDEDGEEEEADKKEADDKQAEAEDVDPKRGEAPQDEVLEKLPSGASPDALLEASANEGVVDPVENDKGSGEGGSPDDSWPYEEAEDDEAASLGGEKPKDSGGKRAQESLVVVLEAAVTVGKDTKENGKSSKKEVIGGSSTTADEKSANDDTRAVNAAAKKEDEEEESPKAASSSSSSNNDGEPSAASTRQGRGWGGWGIRGLGASLLGMEERMRERQQLFRERQQLLLERQQLLREQQLSEAAEKKAREEAATTCAARNAPPRSVKEPEQTTPTPLSPQPQDDAPLPTMGPITFDQWCQEAGADEVMAMLQYNVDHYS